MHFFPQLYPPPWYRLPYPTFYHPPYDISQYQNTLSKELQSKVSQLVQYKKVSPFQCNCKKSKCLKLYCECFTNNQILLIPILGVFIKLIDNPNERSKAIEEALLRNPEAFASILTNNSLQPQVIQEQKFQRDIQKETKKGCIVKNQKLRKNTVNVIVSIKKYTDLCKCENCLKKLEQEIQIQEDKIENRVQIEMIQHQKQQEYKSKKIKKQTLKNNKNKKKD